MSPGQMRTLLRGGLRRGRPDLDDLNAVLDRCEKCDRIRTGDLCASPGIATRLINVATAYGHRKASIGQPDGMNAYTTPTIRAYALSA